MVTFELDGESYSDGEISERWISGKFRDARQNNRLPCFRFDLDTTSAKVGKQTAYCRSAGGVGGRQANPEEAQVLALWERCGLNEEGYGPGNVIKFLNHLKQIY